MLCSVNSRTEVNFSRNEVRLAKSGLLDQKLTQAINRLLLIVDKLLFSLARCTWDNVGTLSNKTYELYNVHMRYRRPEQPSILIHEYDWCQVANVLEVLSHSLSLWLCEVIF